MRKLVRSLFIAAAVLAIVALVSSLVDPRIGLLIAPFVLMSAFYGAVLTLIARRQGRR